MKKIIYLAFILTACTAAPAASAMQPLATQARQIVPTPTETPDYQATIQAAQAGAYDAQQQSMIAQRDAINAQETSAAAMIEIISFTAAAEQLQLDYVHATQGAEATRIVLTQGAEATQIVLTQTAERSTQEYQPTSDAIQATQQAIIIANNITQRGLMTQIADEPRRIEQINYAQYSWLGYMAKIFAGLGLFTISVAVLIFAFRTRQPAPGPQPVATIHYTKTEQDGQYKLNRMITDVPCTAQQLLDLAIGIRKGGMTPAFNNWQGTDVHRKLKDIREFMTANHMTRLIKGKGGELELTELGEDWLDEVIELGDAPLPYKTIPPPQP